MPHVRLVALLLYLHAPDFWHSLRYIVQSSWCAFVTVGWTDKQPVDWHTESLPSALLLFVPVIAAIANGRRPEGLHPDGSPNLLMTHRWHFFARLCWRPVLLALLATAPQSI